MIVHTIYSITHHTETHSTVNKNTPYYANPLYITTTKIKTLLQLTLSTSSHIMKLLPFVIAQWDEDDFYCKLIYSRSSMVAGKCAILIINETQIYRPPNGQNGTNVNKPRNMQTSGAPTSVNVYIFLWKFGIFSINMLSNRSCGGILKKWFFLHLYAFSRGQSIFGMEKSIKMAIKSVLKPFL